MRTRILLLFLLWAGIVFGQEQKSFKERNLVILDSTIYLSLKKKDISIVRKDITYNGDEKIISYKEDTIKKSKEICLFDLNLKEVPLKINSSIDANLKVINNKIMIYPWIFQGDENTEKSNFFNKYDVYIKMKDRVNYSFPYSSVQVGVITLPIKWYMDSKLGNVETSLNAMINVGYKFGKSRFVRFPYEEKAREYKTGFSINGLIGISKIALDEKNTSLSENGKIEGNVAAISLGSSLGYHYNDFTLMIAIGFDLPTSNRKNWNFNGVPWLGLGFGYNFFKFN